MPTTATAPVHHTPRTARTRLGRAAHRIDERTPADRDRVMDLLRVAAMFVVAVGHWLMAVVAVGPDGAMDADSLLATAPGNQWLTLLLQVMGLFFAVGGWASARSLRRVPASRAAWVHGRARRLLAPATAYVAALALLVPTVEHLVGSDLAALVGRFLTVHLWFCAVVVPLYLLTPVLLGVWRAWGWPSFVALTGAALTVDVAHRVAELPGVGWLNFGFVWSAATVLGFAWADGELDRGTARRLLLGGTTVLTVLVASPWIPLSMVGVPGAAQSNNSPPSVALVALTAVHVAVVVLATPRLRRVTARPLVWATVVVAGRGAVTVYLWHLLGMVVLVGIALHAAPATLAITPLTTAWWLTRPLWLLALVVATAPLVALALRFELRLADVAAPSRARTLTATLLASAGCAVLAFHGISTVWAVAAVLAAAVIGRWVPTTVRR